MLRPKETRAFSSRYLLRSKRARHFTGGRDRAQQHTDTTPISQTIYPECLSSDIGHHSDHIRSKHLQSHAQKLKVPPKQRLSLPPGESVARYGETLVRRLLTLLQVQPDHASTCPEEGLGSQHSLLLISKETKSRKLSLERNRIAAAKCRLNKRRRRSSYKEIHRGKLPRIHCLKAKLSKWRWKFKSWAHCWSSMRIAPTAESLGN